MHILEFLQQKYRGQVLPKLIIISFSAGVVGAISAAWGWQLMGGKIEALIAFDGWGVPLVGNFPIYRISHDYFTHWSSSLLGKGDKSFYADPPVNHLDLWRSPQQVIGWRVELTLDGKESHNQCSLRTFFNLLLA